MRKEMEEGTFDADGNFEWRKRNKDEDISDPWLASVDVGDVSATFAVRFTLSTSFVTHC